MASSSPAPPPPQPPPSEPNLTLEDHSEDTSPETYELANVHSVYSSIAPHFSSTRHKPWPLITRFLLSLTPGSVGLDVGCGNGKYLPVNRHVHILASDRSAELLALAKTPPLGLLEKDGKGGQGEGDDGEETKNKTERKKKFTPSQLVVADNLNLPYRPSSVDFIISIAVIHHLSTRHRRVSAIAEMLRCLTPDPSSKCLIFVWALEQSSTSRRAWNQDSDQDTLVPWVMRQKGVPETTYQRYYHLFREGELEDDVVEAGGDVLESGYERDNWWVICTRKQ